MYRITIAGMATMFVKINSTNHSKIKVKGNAFSFHLRLLNFKENIGTSTTSIIESKTPETNIISGLETKAVTKPFTLIIFGKSGNKYKRVQKI